MSNSDLYKETVELFKQYTYYEMKHLDFIYTFENNYLSFRLGLYQQEE